MDTESRRETAKLTDVKRITPIAVGRPPVPVIVTTPTASAPVPEMAGGAYAPLPDDVTAAIVSVPVAVC